MSGLLRTPVNPLNANVDHGSDFVEPPAPTAGYTQDLRSQYVPTQPMPQPVPQPVMPGLVGQTPAYIAAGAVEDDGFSRIQSVGFGAYPRVKLETGHFWLDNDRFGTEFIAQFLKQRPVFVYRPTNTERMPNGDRVPVVWSYDQVFSTKGEDLATLLAAWRAEGFAPMVKEQAEVVAILHAQGHQGKVVLLSIPPQSVARLRGYANVCLAVHGRKATQLLTRVKAGEPIKSGSTSFVPWTFEVAGDLPTQPILPGQPGQPMLAAA